jgi:hypothetical protein
MDYLNGRKVTVKAQGVDPRYASRTGTIVAGQVANASGLFGARSLFLVAFDDTGEMEWFDHTLLALKPKE